jgi:metal-responsive CopG/Arc/MetJ family transcriptional regulator
MAARKVRTTVALSEDLLEAMDSAVREGKVDSRNEFLETALRHELAAHRRAELDAAFTHMADDPIYLREAVEIAEEFGSADWEALRLAEGDS